MSEEEKLNRAIQQDGCVTQSKALEELKRRYPQYVEPLEDNIPSRMHTRDKGEEI